MFVLLVSLPGRRWNGDPDDSWGKGIRDGYFALKLGFVLFCTVSSSLRYQFDKHPSQDEDGVCLAICISWRARPLHLHAVNSITELLTLKSDNGHSDCLRRV